MLTTGILVLPEIRVLRNVPDSSAAAVNLAQFVDCVNAGHVQSSTRRAAYNQIAEGAAVTESQELWLII